MILGEILRNVVDWRELLTPKFWEYRRAARILRRIKSHVWTQEPDPLNTLSVLACVTWNVQDAYYGFGYTHGFSEPRRWPYFWESK